MMCKLHTSGAMMLHLHFVVLLFALSAWSISLSDPTSEEINKGFVLQPWAAWGQQARQQNSLRILCIGGSNTANKYSGGLGYVDLLDTFVRTNLTTDEYFKSHSYAWNRGVSGMTFVEYIGRLYNFELNTNTTEWPNVVIIDSSVNMAATTTKANVQQSFEKLIRSIAFKYKLKGLLCPDFMFYNMPHLKPMYAVGLLEKKSDRAKFVSTYRQNKDFEPDTWIKRFASFYHFPILSWGEATYDAATRHFIEYGFKDHPWSYSEDGIHMSATGGTQLGMDKLLGPFLTAVMKPRKEGELKDVSQWPRMFPACEIPMEIRSYSSYFWHVNVFKLTDIIHDLERSQWKKVSVNHADYCFGSSVMNSMGELRFTVPESCNSMNCKISLAFLHSWNTSYIGNTRCNLHRHDNADHTGVHLGILAINGQDDIKKITKSVESTFEGVSIKEGLYSVKCYNLIEGRLSCMTALNVNAMVVV